MDPTLPTPKDRAEAVAVFRAQIIGPALARPLSRGELAALLRDLAQKEYVPPGAKRRRTFGASTLERWYYAYRRGGLSALRSRPRKDRGRGQKLPPEPMRVSPRAPKRWPERWGRVPLISNFLGLIGRILPDTYSFFFGPSPRAWTDSWSSSGDGRPRMVSERRL
ncbi:MAG TPA: hypothetical protein VH877_06975 [Polyangia bacterium]|jgi:hypothetical protein|nr:hypothetical protein [Polyangia bacterium]